MFCSEFFSFLETFLNELWLKNAEHHKYMYT